MDGDLPEGRRKSGCAVQGRGRILSAENLLSSSGSWCRERDKAGPLVSSIRDAVCWSGPAVIIIFTLGRVEDCLQKATFSFSGVRPEGVEIFRMHPQQGMKGLIVWEYDLTSNDIDQRLVPYLRQCLKKACTDADGVAWSAFEGAFHFDHLFTEDVAEQIYGYCMSDSDPVVVWHSETLESDRWKRCISDVRLAVYRDFL